MNVIRIIYYKVILILYIFSLLIFPFQRVNASVNLDKNANGWKAGVSRVIITPEKPMRMSGYGDRKGLSEGTLHDLWAKALVLEDAKGKQAVLITTDLLGIKKNISDRIRDRLKKKYNLSKSQILINSSHTHTGPVLHDEEYNQKLEDKIVTLVSEALNSMEPVQIYAENGITRFQVNRRNNTESTLNPQTELKGPNDYSVPVIKVVNDAGDLKAIAFGYACHPTVLSGYEWSGDYAGFAQLELEKKYPNATALFFQGAGGDQNPLPRRTVALAQQYGQTLAAAVERVMNEEMRHLTPQLSTAYSEVDLLLTTPPTKEELSKMSTSKESSYKVELQRNWANGLLEKLERGEQLMTSYPYPLQVWQLGDQLIFSLGGEVVIEYAIKLKEIYGQDIFVFGYSNDVMGYIPSAKVLNEGGYEGESSQWIYGLPGLWTPNVELTILNRFIQLVEQEGILSQK